MAAFDAVFASGEATVDTCFVVMTATVGSTCDETKTEAEAIVSKERRKSFVGIGKILGT